MPSVPSFMKPHLSFAPVNVQFPKPRFVPTGSIQATPRTISGGIEGGIAKALSALGVNERKSAQFAQRAMAPLTDVTPVGNAIGAEEGVGLLSRGISKGDATTGALGLGSLLLSILPYGQKAKKPLKSLLADTSGAIRAWHGSPHDFDRFDMSKIGTGEGAQAYGYGLYFAENPKVAQEYRDQLRYAHKRYEVDGKPPEELGLQPNDPILHSAASGNLPRYRRTWENWPRDNEAKIALADRNLRAADLLEGRSVRQITPDGRLYEVNINAEPEDFLDWDAPLGGQGDKYTQAANKIFDPGWDSGAGWAAGWKPTGGDLIGPHSGVVAADRSNILRQAGIPGIRYLDQGSRNALGDLTRNYVVFDDSLIDILNKF